MADEEKATEFNVLNHELVPIHEVLSDDDYTTLVTRYNIIPEQLPKILASDPAVQAVGGRAGQVVRIRRKSRTAGEAVAYRVIIEYPL